jgi:hypothetical protein
MPMSSTSYYFTKTIIRLIQNLKGTTGDEGAYYADIVLPAAGYTGF